MVSGLDLDKYRHPFNGWVNDGQMSEKVKATMANLTDKEKNNVKAVIQILQENGALPPDNPATSLFK
jgi:hypothetical protein